MGVYGNIHGAFNALGKPSIKLEFEDNDELLAFQQRMQEPDGRNDNPDGGNFTPSTYTQEQLDNAVKNQTVTGWGIFPEIPDGWQLVKTSAAPKGFNVITKGEPSFKMTTEGWRFKHSLDAALIEKKKGLKVVKGDEGPVEGTTDDEEEKMQLSLGAPGDTYIITDTRTRARKDLEDTAALKKYDIRKFSGEELQKMQTDDPLLYEQIKSDLEGYGDFYTVRDMRKRSRKEPGDVAANKNLQFTKDSSRTIQNFDKDLYLAQQANPYSFDKEVNGKKYINCDVNVSGRWQDDTRVESYHVNVWFFSPHKKNGKNTFKGYNTYVPVDVELSDFVNLERRKSSEFYGYVPESKYKEWFNEALKKQIAAYQRTIRSGNSYAAENAKDLKYLVEYYSNIDKYTAYVMHNYGDPTLLNPAIVEEYKRYIDTSIFDGVTLGKTANNALYNNLDILDYRGMQPTYRQLSNYDAFFKPAANKNSLKGFGLADTKKLIADICRNHYKECAAIAKHLKAETKLQSAFNLWHWLHHNIRYEYDREGREEVRTPARVWADRHRGVDCDCLSVFTWCVLKCMGYNPAFELAAFRNKPAYSHIYINLDGIVVDRVWYVFNSRPPFITKTELFKVGMLDNLGQLF